MSFPTVLTSRVPESFMTVCSSQRAIIVAEYQGVAEQVSQLLDVDLPALNAKLDAAGAPWTPGRQVPAIK